MPVHLDEEEEDFEDVVDLETISDANTRIGESQKTPSRATRFFWKIQTNYMDVLCQALAGVIFSSSSPWYAGLVLAGSDG